MGKISFPRQEVLQSLYGLTAGISENRFVSTRPNAVGEQMADFVLVRLPQTIYDRGDTYQSTKGQISVFARDFEYGLEDTVRLEEMQQAVLALFPIVTGRYHGKAPILVAGGSDGAGFHFLTIQFHITILKQPKTI